VDGYRYGGRAFDSREVVAELVAQLPTLEAVVFID
jgi:acetoacetyl-CoA synthetase